MFTCTSKPAVKARSPAPVRITARTLGSWDSFLKIAEILSHILKYVCQCEDNMNWGTSDAGEIGGSWNYLKGDIL
jgi:hypothetical protein